MRMTKWIVLASLAMLCPVPVTAQDAINPDRPGIADGSGVVGRGRVQIETGYQYERHREEGETERTHFLPTLLRVGLSSRWEARVESSTFTHVSSVTPGIGADEASGISPISLGLKVHVHDPADSQQPSLSTLVRVFPSSGTGQLHADGTTGDVRLVADWDLPGRVSLNPNVGVGFYQDDQGERVTAALFALTLSYVNGAKTINPFVDIGVQSPEASGGGAALIIDGGVAFLPTRDLQVDVSIGAGAHGHTPPQVFVSVGLSVRFHAWR